MKAPLSQTLFLTEDGSSIAVTAVNAVDIPPLAITPTPTPTPAPSITTPAAISSDGTPQVGEQLTGVDPVFDAATITRRRWLRGTTALATVNSYTPDAVGPLTWSVEGVGDDGSAIKSESTITVAAATPLPIFTNGPTIVGTPKVGQTLTGMSTVTNGSVVSRRWLLGASVVAITQSYVAQAAGSLVYEETATGPGGTTTKGSAAVTVAASTGTPTPTPPSSTLPVLGQSFMDGVNLHTGNYYTASVLESDYGKSIGVAPYDGYANIFVPHAGVTGLATWTTPPGGTFQNGHSSIEVLSSNGSTGVHRINVKADATDTVQRFIRWNGSAPPAYITVVRDGITGEFAPEALNAPMGSFMRNLDMVLQNAMGQNDTVQGDADRTDASPFNNDLVPFERQVRFIAAKRAIDPNFHGLFDVIPIDRTIQQRRDRARYMRDHGGGAYWLFQVGNEDPWNIRFPGVLRIVLEGFRHGFYGSGTRTNPAPLLNVFGQGNYINAGDGASPATAAGGYVLFSIGGRGINILRAKKTVPANSPVDNNEFWETVFDHSTCQAVGKNYAAHYLDETIEIIREEYGETRFAAEVVPLLMGQNGAAGSNGSVLYQFDQHRAFVPGLWGKVKGFGWASYLDPGSADGFDYSTATVERLDWWMRYKAWPHLKNQLAKLQQEADAEGKICVMYEGGPSLVENASYAGPEILAATLGYAQSDYIALMTADYAAHLRQNLRGVAMYYTDIAPDELAGHRVSLFGRRYSFNDTTSKRFVGYQMGIDPSYVPRSSDNPPPQPGTAPPASGAWTPANLSKPVLAWQDMRDSIATLVGGSGADRNDITTLAGIAGLSNATQANAAKRPTLVAGGWDGTIGSARFDNADILAVDVSANGNSFTYAFVIEWDRTGYLGLVTSSTPDAHAIYVDPAGSLIIDKNGVSNVYSSPSDTVRAGKSVVIVTFDRANLNAVSVNGVAGSFTSSAQFGFEGSMQIGNNGGKIDKFAAALRIDGAIGAAEREKLEGYLAHGFAMSDRLVTGHPYKGTPPTA